MKRAIMTAMCPSDIQEIIILKAETWTNYTETKEYITNWVSNKMVLRNTAVPMQVGGVHAECCPGYFDEAEDVGAVRDNTQCYNCGGWGHVARQCPVSKAKGKGKPTSVSSWGGPKGGGAEGGGKDGGAVKVDGRTRRARARARAARYSAGSVGSGAIGRRSARGRLRT